MTVYEEEEAMIIGVKYQLDRVSTRQEINAIYKRARNWNCLHSFWAGACDHDRYAELNEIFKILRKEALQKAEV